MWSWVDDTKEDVQEIGRFLKINPNYQKTFARVVVSSLREVSCYVEIICARSIGPLRRYIWLTASRLQRVRQSKTAYFKLKHMPSEATSAIFL